MNINIFTGEYDNKAWLPNSDEYQRWYRWNDIHYLSKGITIIYTCKYLQ